MLGKAGRIDMSRFSQTRRRLLPALAFLSPNFLGVVVFTLFPVVFSLVMAFSNWDLRHQNMFKPNPVRWVGLDNFGHLLRSANFWFYLGNTLFLMMGIPFAIAGSLFLAILLSRQKAAPSRRAWLMLVVSAVVLASAVVLGLWGMGGSAMTILIGTTVGGILVLGAAGGRSVYRTLMYLPSFTSGMAIFILWKDLYNPDTGPINLALRPALLGLQSLVRGVGPIWIQLGLWVSVFMMAGLAALAGRRLWRLWREADLGTASLLVALALLAIPTVAAWFWFPERRAALGLTILTGAGVLWPLAPWSGARFGRTTWDTGLGSALMLAMLTMTGLFVLEGLGIVCFNLPEQATVGLQPPQWLTSYYWAKPALMIMGFWIAVGSNNMLLYLAGLSNVPQDLYEAADLDGASRLNKFWHVTWPMLAPTTFFIFIMSIIGGLQGGWDVAVAMTQGGPAGATTTLSYDIYTKGFQTGSFGVASAVAWIMFVFVLAATLVSWKFGGQFVSE